MKHIHLSCILNAINTINPQPFFTKKGRKRKASMDGAWTKKYVAQRLLKIQELNMKLMEVRSKTKDAIKRKEMLTNRIAELAKQNDDVWRIEHVEDLDLEELRKMNESLVKFKESLKAVMSNKIAANSGPPIPAIVNFSENVTGEASGHIATFPKPGLRVNEADSNKGNEGGSMKAKVEFAAEAEPK